MDKELRLEDERVLLDRLIQSEGWQLFASKWSRLLKECEVQLRSPDVDNREWLAGLVSGYLRLLKYPEDRISYIDKELAKPKRA